MQQIVHQQVVSQFHHFVEKNPSGDGFKTIVTVFKKEPKRGGEERGCLPHSLCDHCRSLVPHEGINFPLKPKLCFITCEGVLSKEPLTNMTTVFLPRNDTTNKENYLINDKHSDFIHRHFQMIKVENEAKEFHPFLSN